MLKRSSTQKIWMCRLLPLLAIIILGNSALADGTPSSVPATPSGTWVVNAVLDYAPIVAIDGEAASKLPGKQIAFDEKSVRFLDLICDEPRVTRSRVKTKAFFQRYRLEVPRTLPKEMASIDFVCAGQDSLGLSPLLSDHGSFLVIWRGVLLSIRPDDPRDRKP